MIEQDHAEQHDEPAVSLKKWLRLLYLLPLILLLPPVFIPAVNMLTNFLNWTDKVFGWDWHALAFAIMRWFDPSWNPGA